MATLIEKLPDRIARLEPMRGSDSPFVQQLKEQLRAMKETSDRPGEEIYLLGSKPKK